ncbi:MAG: MarR family transcriptional regulator [Pseudomonadota bacterium]
MKTSIAKVELNRKAFLGKAAQDLLTLSSAQVAVVYEQRGLDIPVEVSSTLLFLNQHERSVLTDVATALDIPHQLAAQRVAKLGRRGLIAREKDSEDRRRAYLTLTPAGRAQAQVLEQCMADMAVIYDELYREIDCDLPTKLLQAIDSLKRCDLATRFAETF